MARLVGPEILFTRKPRAADRVSWTQAKGKEERKFCTDTGFPLKSPSIRLINHEEQFHMASSRIMIKSRFDKEIYVFCFLGDYLSYCMWYVHSQVSFPVSYPIYGLTPDLCDLEELR